jgi:hypothetical protein
MKRTQYITRQPVIKKLPEDADLIHRFGKKMFWLKKGNVYFDEHQVTPDFYYLMKVPFHYWMTITYTSKYYSTPTTEKGRNWMINTKILYPLNGMLKKSYPTRITGNKTVRYVRVNEVGVDGKIHVHILFYIHPDLEELVKDEVWRYLKKLNSFEMEGVMTMDCDKVPYQEGLISYFCKIQWKQDYKHFDFSIGFKEVIEKFHTNDWVKEDKDFFKRKPYVPDRNIVDVMVELERGMELEKQNQIHYAENNFCNSVASASV